MKQTDALTTHAGQKNLPKVKTIIRNYTQWERDEMQNFGYIPQNEIIL